MSLKKLWQYYNGYCQIILKGPRRERFINLAATRGILLFDILPKNSDAILCKVYLQDIKELRHIARLSRCPFKIISKKGLPFLILTASKRKMLVSGLILFIITLYLLSSFIWFVDITSKKPLRHVQKGEIIVILKSMGIKPGKYKGNVNTGAIEKRLLQDFPNIAFTCVEIRGTLLNVDIVEKQIPEDTVSPYPSHLIAKKDGIIEEMLILTGEPKVKVGDTVQKGQILISGIVPNRVFNQETGLEELTDLPPKIVKAKGIVKARVWYEEKLIIPLQEKKFVLTGKKITVVNVKIGNNIYRLMGPKKIPYKTYDEKQKITKLNSWRNSSVPVEIIKLIYSEKVLITKVQEREQAINNSQKLLVEKLKKEINPETEILDKKITVNDLDSNKIAVSIWIEAKEEISAAKDFEN